MNTTALSRVRHTFKDLDISVGCKEAFCLNDLVFLPRQSSWSSMRTLSTRAASGTIWLRFLGPRPRLTWSSLRTSTTASECWDSMTWASAVPACPRASTGPAPLVRHTCVHAYTRVHTHLLASNVSLMPTAPDENPTEVKGHGTEHNNLVITWKVRRWLLINISYDDINDVNQWWSLEPYESLLFFYFV